MKKTTSSARAWLGLLALAAGGCVDKTPPPLWPTPPPPSLAAPIGGWSERPAASPPTAQEPPAAASVSAGAPAQEPAQAQGPAQAQAPAPARTRPDDPIGPWRPAAPR